MSAITSPPIDQDERWEPVRWPFRVLARTGKVLGDFDRLNDALDAYNTQATAIIIGNNVVCQRQAGAP